MVSPFVAGIDMKKKEGEAKIIKKWLNNATKMQLFPFVLFALNCWCVLNVYHTLLSTPAWDLEYEGMRTNNAL